VIIGQSASFDQFVPSVIKLPANTRVKADKMPDRAEAFAALPCRPSAVSALQDDTGEQKDLGRTIAATVE